MDERLINQANLLGDDERKIGIGIVGVGAIGSFVALGLTKMGFTNVSVWDDDKLETHNTANQMYPLNLVGKFKVEALYEVCRTYSGEIAAHYPVKFTIDQSFPAVLIVCVDNMATRKQIFEGWKRKVRNGWGTYWFVEARMGGQNYRVYSFKSTDDEAVNFYENNCLYSDEEAVQERCGQKSIIYTVFGVAADVCNQVRRMLMDLPFKTEVSRNYDYQKPVVEPNNGEIEAVPVEAVEPEPVPV